jgi:hypothetical protein
MTWNRNGEDRRRAEMEMDRDFILGSDSDHTRTAHNWEIRTSLVAMELQFTAAS